MRRAFVLLLLIACSKETPAPPPAASSVAASSGPAAQPLSTRSAWWDLAQKSKVFTDDRRIDADNRLKMLPVDQRVQVVAVLDDMARQPATAVGFHDAAERARQAQERITDPNGSSSDHSPVFRAIAETSLIVLSGLVAKACADKADMKALAIAIRQAPLPRIPAPGLGQLSDGRNERNQIEQEMRMALDDKAFKAAFDGAPPPAKNPP